MGKHTLTRIVRSLLIVVGLINGLPVVGVISADVLSILYGIPGLEGDLLGLMQHRAILLGLLGVFLLVAAFRPALQTAAMVAALVSMLGFILIVLTAGEQGAKLSRIAQVDAFALIGLVAAAILRWRASKPGWDFPRRD